MTEPAFEQLVAAANEVLAHPRRDATIGVDDGSATATPRFELHHAAPSLCSFKVRTVLFERGIPFRSHDMNILPSGGSIPENYRPEYVRLRMHGAPNAKLVDGCTGASSVATEGFDPCVVPTLVDHEKERVVVDSARICEHLDREWTLGDPLMPDGMADEIRSQIDLVDRAPHVAVLYGAHPESDNRPDGLRVNIKDVHAKKIAAIEVMMGEVRAKMKTKMNNAEETLAAYRAKIIKESSASQFVYDGQRMRAAHEAMGEHVEALATQLEGGAGPWALVSCPINRWVLAARPFRLPASEERDNAVWQAPHKAEQRGPGVERATDNHTYLSDRTLGDRYTLADVMWTNSLYRLKWLGMGHLWEERLDRAGVVEYSQRAFERPSFRRAVIQWPVAYGPSPHVREFSGPLATVRFLWQMLRRRPL